MPAPVCIVIAEPKLNLYSLSEGRESSRVRMIQEKKGENKTLKVMQVEKKETQRDSKDKKPPRRPKYHPPLP